MVCVPTVRLEVLKVAVVRPLAVLSVPWPMLVPPSEKVTEPLGLPEPLAGTVAGKVTDWPDVDGLSEEVTAVVVATVLELTVWPPARVPLLPAKLLSPL